MSGQIRTTVGQAVLLMNQRFKQFTGLVDNCEFKTGEKETTCTDLDGFWDMIYFQVIEVYLYVNLLTFFLFNHLKFLSSEKTMKYCYSNDELCVIPPT